MTVCYVIIEHFLDEKFFFCDEPLHNDSKSCVKKVEKADVHLTSNEHQNPSTLRSIGNPKWMFQAEARWKREAEAGGGIFWKSSQWRLSERNGHFRLIVCNSIINMTSVLSFDIFSS